MHRGFGCLLTLTGPDVSRLFLNFVARAFWLGLVCALALSASGPRAHAGQAKGAQPPPRGYTLYIIPHSHIDLCPFGKPA